MNFANLFKELSGYEVRIGFPRHLFSASVGAGVYNPSAAAAIGMVLAAKDDRMPDCVTRPEPAWADAPEAETVEETAGAAEEGEGGGFYVPSSDNTDYENGETGTLIPMEEYGTAEEPGNPETAEEPEKPGKPGKPDKPGKPKRPRKPAESKPKIQWIKGKFKGISEKFKNGVLDFYDEMTREEDANDNQ